MNIGIVGLGLMGGSFAKAVKRYGIAKNIYGFANSEKNKKDILELKLVDELVDLKTLKEVSDVIILAIPVDSIIALFPEFLDIDDKTTIIDMGSTKEYIVKNIPQEIRKNFVAAHPMTGTEKSGPKAAIDNLYEGKTVVLCDLEDNEELHKSRAFLAPKRKFIVTSLPSSFCTIKGLSCFTISAGILGIVKPPATSGQKE